MESKKRKTEENGGSEEVTAEDVGKMIEAFSREQLAEIVQEAATKHKDVLEAVRGIADKDPAQRKLFVRGLGWDTSTDSLKALFSHFGELEEGVVIMDKNTGKSKGYGFVTFKHMDGALNALKEPSKKIDGRMTVSQLASAGSQHTQPSTDVTARKIYVGNVPIDMPADRLLSLFSQYGEIEEGPLGFDKQSGRSRGFALFIFKTVDATRRSLEEPSKFIEGHHLFCKLAVEGQKQKPGGGGGSGGGGVNSSATDGSDINASNQSHVSGIHFPGFVNTGLGASNPAGLAAHQGLSHHGLGASALSGLGAHSNPGGIPGGSMGHPVNPSSMNLGLHGASNPAASSLSMGVGAGGYGGLGSYAGGAGGGGGYGGSQGVGGGYTSVFPSSQSAGFPDGPGHYPLSGYQNQHQHQHQQSAASPVPRVSGGGMYPGAPFYPV